MTALIEGFREVRLLSAGALEFRQALGVLTVKLPEKLPVFAANALRIVPAC